MSVHSFAHKITLELGAKEEKNRVNSGMRLVAIFKSYLSMFYRGPTKKKYFKNIPLRILMIRKLSHN